jgi:hypothetical protein
VSSPSVRVAVSILALLAGHLPVFGEAAAPAPAWGLSERLSATLARQADAYLDRARRLACVETVRRVRYMAARPIVKERRYEFVPGRSFGDSVIPEFRFEISPRGKVRKRAWRRSKTFPSAHDWARLFSASNQPYFMYRDLGIRIEGFDLVREIQFRGWLPFTDGRDIRQWEGTALVEITALRIVEIRARPRNQDARVAKLYDKWSRSFKITLGLFAGPLFVPLKTFRMARRPLAHYCFLRFDCRRDGARLPSLLRYEARRAVSREETARRSISTRRYHGYRIVGGPNDVNPLHLTASRQGPG